MAYRETIRLNIRCAKHTRFRPENGPGGVKAGCADCFRLVDVYQMAFRLKILANPLQKPSKPKGAE